LKDRQKTKQENYKCFLYGKSKEFEKNMLVVPSFLPLIAGTDVSQRDSKMESRIQVENFEVFALDDEGKMYDFGKVKNLR
jgi:metallophosphoesterase superfamily enzyme